MPSKEFLDIAVCFNSLDQQELFFERLLNNRNCGLQGGWEKRKGVLFPNGLQQKLLELEEKEGRPLVKGCPERWFASLSSGERKIAMLSLLDQIDYDYLLLSDPYDCLDQKNAAMLQYALRNLSNTKGILQVVTKPNDLLPFIKRYHVCVQAGKFEEQPDRQAFLASIIDFHHNVTPRISLPSEQQHRPFDKAPLFSMRGVNVAYQGRPILKDISWTVGPNEFWQLEGPNGSGKSTLLSLLTGDNPKAYGQDITLFGTKRGSGESIWDIKKNIGLVSPILAERFKMMHSLIEMVAGGMHDSIGLYQRTSDKTIQTVMQWLSNLGIGKYGQKPFVFLPEQVQRIALIARAMIKEPPLLILDEPTAGMDVFGTAIVEDAIQQLSEREGLSIVYVSHDRTTAIKPRHTFHLEPGKEGSIGKAVRN